MNNEIGGEILNDFVDRQHILDEISEVTWRYRKELESLGCGIHYERNFLEPIRKLTIFEPTQ